jgi:hypothetical protein
MRIEFESSGGFANIMVNIRVDSKNLPDEVNSEIIRLVEESDFFNIKSSELQPKHHGPPDVMQYKICLQDGKKINTLSVNDVTAPERLRPLLGYLQQLAIAQKTGKPYIK